MASVDEPGRIYGNTSANHALLIASRPRRPAHGIHTVAASGKPEQAVLLVSGPPPAQQELCFSCGIQPSCHVMNVF